MTSIKQAFVHCVIKNATNASDRASRSEFWWFFLFAVIMGGACYASATMVPHAGWVLATILAIPTIWLFVMTFIRRLHDHNLPALVLVLPVLPFAMLYQLTGEYFIIPQSYTELSVGLYAISSIIVLYLIYLLFKSGTLGDNRYGTDPSHGPTNPQAKKATKEAAKNMAAREIKEINTAQEKAKQQDNKSTPAPAEPSAKDQALPEKAQDTKEAVAPKALETSKQEPVKEDVAKI